MSSFLTPSVYSKNGLDNQWVNLIWNSHDLYCGCNDAFRHLADILQKKGQQLCLPSTSTASTADAGIQTGDDHGEDVLEPGDLDKLFEEDFTEDDG